MVDICHCLWPFLCGSSSGVWVGMPTKDQQTFLCDSCKIQQWIHSQKTSWCWPLQHCERICALTVVWIGATLWIYLSIAEFRIVTGTFCFAPQPIVPSCVSLSKGRTQSALVDAIGVTTVRYYILFAILTFLENILRQDNPDPKKLNLKMDMMSRVF